METNFVLTKRTVFQNDFKPTKYIKNNLLSLLELEGLFDFEGCDIKSSFKTSELVTDFFLDVSTL